ncbi:hypothetical protein SAMN05216548_12221 [Faunimonas pinastri]|uniref:Pyridoxamine 5'-phosphate oxidase N-terminal domain-containing protein n=1 Tax=Faunimonas pinastri TaxID=1855383 RepID=A0A1H9PS52_9HYPH|nr:pyridoxamine 5'-phosphate oxidase family protein [Faunimonas pinastri]SER50940.1 hypothetical protein SAMN05216548_12221 [Faunimonas pinastri]
MTDTKSRSPEGANHGKMIEIARAMLREPGPATLATLSAEGAPFASLVTFAPDRDAAPLLLLSGLAVHTGNLRRDPRASLLIAAGAETADPLTAPRLTLTGRIVREADQAGTREVFLAGQPEAALYIDFGDFALYRMAVEGAHFVAGFGRIGAIAAEALLGD